MIKNKKILTENNKKIQQEYNEKIISHEEAYENLKNKNEKYRHNKYVDLKELFR